MEGTGSSAPFFCTVKVSEDDVWQKRFVLLNPCIVKVYLFQNTSVKRYTSDIGRLLSVKESAAFVLQTKSKV